MPEDGSHSIGRRRFVKGSSALAATAAFGSVVDVIPGRDPGPKPHELLVGLSPALDTAGTIASIEAALPEHATLVHHNPHVDYVAVAIADVDVAADSHPLAGRLRGLEGVRYVEQNTTFEPMAEDVLEDQQYAPDQVRAPVAWTAVPSDPDVTIAVVDQGVAYDHPDLREQFEGEDGRDFVDTDDDPYPDDEGENHGTHVAGIAAAGRDNGEGVAGVGDGRLLSLRVLSPQGAASDIADAIDYARRNGADLINMSLGGGGYRRTMQEALSDAVADDVLPIAAAGNACTSPVEYPARYDECVAVSALDDGEYLASFSNYGRDVDLAGPGVDVLSCWTTETEEYGGKYNAISGTSMACPAVTGVAALGKAANPNLSATQLRGRLKETAVDVGLDPEEQGAGRADAAALVDAARGSDGSAPTPRIDPNVTDPHVGENVTFYGTPSSDAEGYIAEWSWELGDGTSASGERVVHSYDSTGEQTITLTVTDDEGSTATTTTSVTVQAGACGRESNEESFGGRLSYGEDKGEHEYAFATTEPCSVHLTLDGPDEAMVFAIHGELTRTGCNGELHLPSRTLDPNASLTIGAYQPDGSRGGAYEISLSEQGFGQGSPNEGPTATLQESATTVETGRAVEFDASGSSDPDGSIVEYAWTFGDGGSATGATVEHAYDAAGSYTVGLTVTDDDDASDTATTTIDVLSPDDGDDGEDGGDGGDGGGGGSCGGAQESARATDSLSGYWDSASYTYTTRLAEPCQLALSLTGPDGTDFDLYATTDGRTPSSRDYDAKSTTRNSEETVLLEDVGPDQEIGILVDAYRGSGEFTIAVEEIGR